ncbi:hypothetical protein SASPL_130217 [Salvia splendens]|uniref:Uncharacterized protein n=1 Tax=Salvia splendens TaxID=180675 RepID=A0A8X8ZJQ1_SALSN|nr:hypothetical protein SASPL_130217 [Salvia splendens]
MVRPLLCNPSLSPLSPPPPSSPTKPALVIPPLSNSIPISNSDYSQRIPSISQAFSSTLISLALSLGLFCASPSHSTALEPVPLQQELICREYDDYVDDKSTGEAVTNEEIVEEAWQIVNDSFLETGRHRWSPDSWLKKKEDVLGGSIQSRSRAHDIIRRMLASLGDPYTRFLPPADVTIFSSLLPFSNGKYASRSSFIECLLLYM